MGIYEKPIKSGIWHISYCDGSGQRHREKVGGRREAELAYHKRKTEIREGRYFPPRSGGRLLTFRALAALAMEYKKPRIRPSSYITDIRHLEHLYPMLGHMEAKKIRPMDIDTVLSKFHKGRSGSTVNRYRSLLSSIFGYGVRAELLLSNPVAMVERFRESDHRTRWLQDDEESRLRTVIRARYPEREAELDLALYTGMRRGEQFSLKWENVNIERGSATVYGKSGRREVTLNSSAKAALEKLKRAAAVYVCPETKSDTQQDWRRWFEEAIKETGITNFRWHDLRHTFASRLVIEGVPLLTVSGFLGHRSITMTQRYAHLSPDHRRTQIEKIGAKRE